MNEPTFPRFRFDDGLKNTVRWLLLAALVYAPAAFGCTRPEPKHLLTLGLLGLLGLFLASLALSRRLPRVPPVAAGLSLLLMAYGWSMIGNARQEYDFALHRFFDLEPAWRFLPGVVDRTVAIPQMALLTGLFGAFWITADAADNPVWRNRFWLALGLTGSAVLAYGLVARFTGLDERVFHASTAFATYRYHANAGAFINLVLPFVAYRAIDAAGRRTGPAVRAFWCLAALMTAASGFINVSRVSAILTALLLVLIFVDARFRLQKSGHLLAVAGAGLAAVAVLAWAFGLEGALRRWPGFLDQAQAGSRYLVYGAIWTQALPVSGWWGFGPGTFQITFPFFTNHLGPEIAGIWRYAHCDYLQTLMEWGWLGAALWAALLFGGLGRGAAGAWKPRPGLENHRASLLTKAAFFAVLGVSLHALVDFPLQIASLQLYAAVALALLWKTPRKERAE